MDCCTLRDTITGKWSDSKSEREYKLYISGASSHRLTDIKQFVCLFEAQTAISS